MAKLSGPEEFFEVFRHDKQPAPGTGKPEQPPVGQQQPTPAPVYLTSLAAKPSSENAIQVRFSTLIFAGVCVVLLMVLSYFAGKEANRPVAPGSQVKAPAVPPKDFPPGRFGTNLVNQHPQTPGRQSAVGQAEGRFELEVMRYRIEGGGEALARDLTAFLKTLPTIRSNAVGVGYDPRGTEFVVWIGPFISDRSQAAREVQNEVMNTPYNGKKRFASSTAFKAIQPHR